MSSRHRAVLVERRYTKTNTEVAAEVIVDDDDAGLDQHLLDRNIERPNHAANVLQTFRRVLHQQRIGAIVNATLPRSDSIGSYRSA